MKEKKDDMIQPETIKNGKLKKERRNKSVKYKMKEKVQKKRKEQESHSVSEDVEFPTSFENISLVFTHIYSNENKVSHLIANKGVHKIRISVNHIKYLDKISREKCEEYIKGIPELLDNRKVKIEDAHTFMIAYMKPKPKNFPSTMKPLVVHKWMNNQYYLVYGKRCKEKYWLSRNNVGDKEKVKRFHKEKKDERYKREKLPRTFKDENSEWGNKCAINTRILYE